MKRILKIALAVFLLGFVSASGFAQDAQEISDEQLRKYAILQEVVNLMKKDISKEINGLIKAQEGMTGKRYKELSGAKGDADALASIEAKDWEIKFMEQTNKIKDDRTTSIKTVNSELATKMVGDRGKTYKAIRELLKSDADLKSRYDAIYAGLQIEGV